MTEFFLQGLSLGFPAGALPGPFMAYLFSQTLRNGWKKTLPAALAPILSDGPIILLMVLILTQLPSAFLLVIQFVGGAFIIYLSWRALQTFMKPADGIELAPDEGAQSQSLIEASVMNLLNPNPYIFWGTAGALVLVRGFEQSPATGAVFLGAFYGALLSVNVGLIIVFGVARTMGPTVVKWLSGIAAIALFVFGVIQIISGIQTLAGV